MDDGTGPTFLKQPQRRRRQERQWYAYLATKNDFARFARVFFIFVHLAAVLVVNNDVKWHVLLLFCTGRKTVNFFASKPLMLVKSLDG